MSKRKILLLIPVTVIAGFLIYTWSVILFTNTLAVWRHYTGLLLFAVVFYFLFTSFNKGVFAMGIYLITGTLNMVSITPDVLDFWGFRVGSLEISLPIFQPLLFIIFLLYFFLNFDTLINMHLNYKEAKELKRRI